IDHGLKMWRVGSGNCRWRVFGVGQRTNFILLLSFITTRCNGAFPLSGTNTLMAIGVLITLLHFPPSHSWHPWAVTESDSNATCVAIFGRLDQTPTMESVNKCDK
ncbi:hypothetical protein BJY52DRAFT_1298729, partial [Lactarius psammicola]